MTSAYERIDREYRYYPLSIVFGREGGIPRSTVVACNTDAIDCGGKDDFFFAGPAFQVQEGARSDRLPRPERA